ncbi:MAG: hypothetical protein U1E22_01510, partial [Coriobacteriia bacterium]|nr:hypothetical protein [Coriobacteriia bacterium]
MKRTPSVFLVALLVAVLLVPAAALAKGGSDAAKGQGKSSAPGQVKKAGGDAAEADAAGSTDGSALQDGEDAVETDTDSDGTGARKGKAFGKTKQNQLRSREASGAAESDGERKRTGIENAIDRIQANIAKAEAKVAAGTKK